ncbi:putative exonuclease GOR [Liparis tanakae]|uniref:Putative exonuclease GOR n=1 Tax=Liparis tanakae TaxID=230148 RepID=A0A4Z2H4Z9_9TELE|nr:putative exonuclease GOR [Liparis tanakae]
MVNFAGEQTGYPSTDETKDDSLQELERINKEIETVRHEVEHEQRRLSRYQTVLADSVKTEPNYSVSKSETGARNVDGGTYGLSSRADSTRTYSRSRKYVVDNSKPRTDLEYDPLSNFSAGLRSGSSSAKEPKGKHGPDATSNTPCGQHAEQIQTAEQPAQDRVSSPWSSALPQSQNMSSKMHGWFPCPAAAPEGYPVPAEPLSLHSSASSLAIPSELSSASTGQLFVTEDADEELIIIQSSSDEEELNYSELSDSDPMEECYRIFMEANEEKGNEEQPDVSVGAVDVEKPKFNVKPQALPGKKRVAHDAKHTEPLVKSRPQPQVLVPLRAPAVSGFSSQPSTTSKIQQAQQRASMLTASVKAGQAFVSSACQRKPESQSASFAFAQTPENLQPAPVHHAHMNYISLGTAVIGADNNLHLILPEGIFPLPGTSGSSHVTSVLTPISQVHPNTVSVRQMYHPAAAISLQRYRTTAPMLIPAPARKPSLASAFASSHSSPAAFAAPPAAVHTAVKAVATKRRLKQSEAAKEKVPHEIRQRYVNMFTEEFLKTTENVNDAFEKALAEEKAVYNRSVNKLKYFSVAVNALKRLKNQSALTAKDDVALYEILRDYVLTEEKLVESNYPVQHPEKPGSCVLFIDIKKGSADPLKRICCRCGSTYSVNQMGKHIRKEECNYHYGKGVHVHDSISLDGFVSTVPRHPSDASCPGVYSLDCEMCYTIHGLELSRVTVVNSSVQVVYDTFIRPDNELLHGTVIDTSVVFPHRLGLPHKLTLNNLTADYLMRIIQESAASHFSQLLSLSLSLFLSSTAPPEAETAGLDEEEYEGQNNGEEEGQDVQAVVLVPGELVGLHPQVLGPFVSHGELDPEYRLITRTHRSVVVDTGQPQGVLLVYNNCGSLRLDVDHVVRLVSEHGDAHHGNAVVDGLIDPIGATVGDERPGLGVT